MTFEINDAFDIQESQAKREALRAISLHLVGQIARDQLDASDMVVDDLIDLAEQGQVVPRGAEGAFGFGGLDLIVQIVVPAAVSVLTTVHISRRPTGRDQPSAQILITDERLIQIAHQAGFDLLPHQIAKITRSINALVGLYLESETGTDYRPDQMDIDDQRQLLKWYRRTLYTYLEQRAMLGAAYTPPGVNNGIDEVRTEIRRIKGILRGWGGVVENHPDDEPSDV